MAAVLLDGKQLADTLRAEIAAGVVTLVQKRGIRPGVAAVLVGDNPASQLYVKNKRKACEKPGLQSWQHEMPASKTQQELLDLVTGLNIEAGATGLTAA